MSFFALSKLLALAVAVGGALGAFSPPRFAMTSWDTPAATSGVRIFGSTPDRSGILELSLNGVHNLSSTAPYPWHASVHLLGTIVTAQGSDFAAISEQGGGNVAVFFIRDNGALAFASSPNSTAESWSLGLVGGNPAPAPGTSLAAARWGPNHVSVFYQDSEGVIFESELTNNTWAAPVGFATANIGTDISAWGTNTNGLKKFVYVQSVRRFQEWTYTASTGNWTEAPLDAITVQPSDANLRFAMSYLPTDTPPSRIYYKSTTAGKISESTGTPGGGFTHLADLTEVNNMPATSDIATVLQLQGYVNNWAFVVYTGPDGTLQQEVFRSTAGWGPPSQIAPSPNKVKGTA